MEQPDAMKYAAAIMYVIFQGLQPICPFYSKPCRKLRSNDLSSSHLTHLDLKYRMKVEQAMKYAAAAIMYAIFHSNLYLSILLKTLSKVTIE